MSQPNGRGSQRLRIAGIFTIASIAGLGLHALVAKVALDTLLHAGCDGEIAFAVLIPSYATHGELTADIDPRPHWIPDFAMRMCTTQRAGRDVTTYSSFP